MREIIKKILRESDLDWIKNVSVYPTLNPKTMYYFEPAIKGEEVIDLFGKIDPKEENIKRWVKDRMSDWSRTYTQHEVKKEINPITYFAVDYTTWDPKSLRIVGWCSETCPIDGRDFYPEFDFVDGREHFSSASSFFK